MYSLMLASFYETIFILDIFRNILFKILTQIHQMNIVCPSFYNRKGIFHDEHIWCMLTCVVSFSLPREFAMGQP